MDERDLTPLLLSPRRYPDVFVVEYLGARWRGATSGWAIAFELTDSKEPARDGIVQALPTEWSEPVTAGGLPRWLDGASMFFETCGVCRGGELKTFACVECDIDDPEEHPSDYAECEACGNTRKQSCCPECEGDFEHVLAPTREGILGDRVLNRNLVRTYLAPFGMPDTIQLAVGGPLTPVRFNGPDWMVLVMPMRPTGRLSEGGSRDLPELAMPGVIYAGGSR